MIKSVTAYEAKYWLDADQAILIDVREPAEYAAKHIPNAILQPCGSISCMKLPVTSQKIILHCQKGMRGEKACQKILAENPAIEIYNLEGGIEAWQQSGYPVAISGKRMLPLDRQVQLTVGLSVLSCSLLAYLVHPAFALAAAFIGAGLTNAGLTGWCGLAKLLAKMPWNRYSR